MLNKLRALIHRLKARSIRRSVARQHRDLEEYYTTEGTRLSILSTRADWHDNQAEQLHPQPKAERPATRAALGRGLEAILTTTRFARK